MPSVACSQCSRQVMTTNPPGGVFVCSECKRASQSTSPKPAAVQPPVATPAPVGRIWFGPWYYSVCHVSVLALGGYSLLTFGILTLNAFYTLLQAMARRPDPDLPPQFQAQLQGLTAGFAFLQLAMYFGGVLATIVGTTFVCVVLDSGRRLREIRDRLER